MRERGARVIALDRGPGMLALLRGRTADLPAVVAVGERLPVRDGCADLVTYAQAWHWVDVATAAAEAVRVLRPGGALAVWWNQATRGVPWYEAQLDRLEAAVPGYTREYRSEDYGAQLRATGLFTSVTGSLTSWTRVLDLDTYERWLRSKSYVAVLGEGVDDFVASERAHLRAVFPDGRVIEPFTVDLWVAHRS